MGAHVTSETPPNLSKKFEKLAVDNLHKMYHNKQRWLVNQLEIVKKCSGESSYGGIAQLGERLNGIQGGQRFDPAYLHQTNHKAKALWFELFKEKLRNRIPRKGAGGASSKALPAPFFGF